MRRVVRGGVVAVGVLVATLAAGCMISGLRDRAVVTGTVRDDLGLRTGSGGCRRQARRCRC